MSKVPAVFAPLTIRGITFKNRIFMSPMCMYSAKEGAPNDWHMSHLVSRAAGGVGLVMAEATGVNPAGRITYGCTGLYNEEQAKKWSEIVESVHNRGTKIGIQIGHAGRKAACAVPQLGGGPLTDNAWQIVAPSAIPFDEKSAVPKELTTQEIYDLVEDFRKSATLAVKAGFDLLELHGAHGYLIHEFNSPISNKRTDEFGGSFENRTRFLTLIVKAVREVIPDSMPLFLRISSEDLLPNGWTLDDSVQLAKNLKPLGVDLIDCSGGFIAPGEKFNFGPAYQAHYAEKIRKEADILTISVGGIATAEVANDVVEKGKADAVMIGKQLLFDPYFALNAARQLGIEKKEADAMWPTQYAWVRRYLP